MLDQITIEGFGILLMLHIPHITMIGYAIGCRMIDE
jgi:hypothetical protein